MYRNARVRMRKRARLCEPGSNNPAQQPGIHPHPPPPYGGGGVWGEKHPGGSEVGDVVDEGADAAVRCLGRCPA